MSEQFSSAIGTESQRISKVEQEVRFLADSTNRLQEALYNFLWRGAHRSSEALINHPKGLKEFIDSAHTTRVKTKMALGLVKEKMERHQTLLSPPPHDANQETLDEMVNQLFSTLMVFRIAIESAIHPKGRALNHLAEEGGLTALGGNLLDVKRLLFKTLKRIYEWEIDEGITSKLKEMMRELMKEIKEDSQYEKSRPVVKKRRRVANSTSDKNKSDEGDLRSRVGISWSGKLSLNPSVYKVQSHTIHYAQLMGYEVQIVESNTPDYDKIVKKLKANNSHVIIAIERSGETTLAKIKIDALLRVDKKTGYLPKEDQKTKAEIFAEIFDLSSAVIHRVVDVSSNGHPGLADQDLYLVDKKKYGKLEEYKALCRELGMVYKKGTEEKESEEEKVEREKSKNKFLVSLIRKTSSGRKMCFAVVDKRAIKSLEEIRKEEKAKYY